MARHGPSAKGVPQTGAAAARTRASPYKIKRIAGAAALIHSLAGTGGGLRIAGSGIPRIRGSGIDARSRRIVENRGGDFALAIPPRPRHLWSLPTARPPTVSHPPRHDTSA